MSNLRAEARRSFRLWVVCYWAVTIEERVSRDRLRLSIHIQFEKYSNIQFVLQNDI